MAYNIIFDIDQTIVDSSCAKQYRDSGDWNTAYQMIENGQIKPYKGIVDLIIDAHNNGHTILFVSSSPREYSEKILKKIGLGWFVEQGRLVAYHDTSSHKPNPEPYEKALTLPRVYRMQPLVVVGDNPNDILACSNLRFPQVRFAIRAMWGVSSADFNSEDHSDFGTKPYMIVETVHELRDFLNYEWPIRYDESQNAYCFNYYPTSDAYWDFITYGILHTFKNNEDMIFYKSQKSDKISNPHRPLLISNWTKRFLQAYVKKQMKDLEITDAKKVAILLVPSSSENKWCEMLQNTIIPEVCKQTGVRNESNQLLRHTARESAHTGNDRSIETNLNTIRIENPDELCDLSLIIIVDDITTSGNTFEACKQIVHRDCAGGFHGDIICVAMAKTRHVLCGREETEDLGQAKIDINKEMIYKIWRYLWNPDNLDTQYHLQLPYDKEDGIQCSRIPTSGATSWYFNRENDISWFAPIGYSICEECNIRYEEALRRIHQRSSKCGAEK